MYVLQSLPLIKILLGSKAQAPNQFDTMCVQLYTVILIKQEPHVLYIINIFLCEFFLLQMGGLQKHVAPSYYIYCIHLNKPNI